HVNVIHKRTVFNCLSWIGERRERHTRIGKCCKQFQCSTLSPGVHKLANTMVELLASDVANIGISTGIASQNDMTNDYILHTWKEMAQVDGVKHIVRHGFETKHKVTNRD